MKIWLIGAVVAVIGAGGVGVYVMEKPSPNDAPPTVSLPSADAEIPTPQYLFAHQDVLKEAEQKCQRSSDPSSLYCTNVQKAESLRLADQYRRSVQPEGGGK